MKYCCLVIVVVFLSFQNLYAQGRTTRVKAGEDVAQAYSPNGFYRFPVFSNAVLYYRSGGHTEAQKFNYNILSAGLQFIGPKGDTLELNGQAALDSAVFEKNVFLYREGWMEVIARADSITLLKKIFIKTQLENVGAYGVANSTASIDNIKTYSSGSGVFNLILNQDVVIIENVSWFIKDGSNNISKASKPAVLKSLSPAAQGKADAWFKQNKVNFEKENDLRKLMQAITN